MRYPAARLARVATTTAVNHQPGIFRRLVISSIVSLHFGQRRVELWRLAERVGFSSNGSYAPLLRLFATIHLRFSVNYHDGFGSPPSMNPTADMNTSITQWSTGEPVFSQSLSYNKKGFAPTNCLGLVIPIEAKSFAMNLPIFGRASSLETVSLSGFLMIILLYSLEFQADNNNSRLTSQKYLHHPELLNLFRIQMVVESFNSLASEICSNLPYDFV